MRLHAEPHCERVFDVSKSAIAQFQWQQIESMTRTELLCVIRSAFDSNPAGSRADPLAAESDEGLKRLAGRARKYCRDIGY